MPKGKRSKEPTPRQAQVYRFISDHITRESRPPTIREIGAFMGVGSTNAVRGVLTALEKKGYIKRTSFLSRAIELTRQARKAVDTIRIPIVGRVAAGLPLLAVENIEGEITVSRDLIRAEDGFALRVKGQSMIEAGINDGDLVLARPDLPVDQGSIVVALIGDEATVKRYYVDGNLIRLEPANPHFEPIQVQIDDPGFRIAGRVVGLYRKY
jgi:repressor LexA